MQGDVRVIVILQPRAILLPSTNITCAPFPPSRFNPLQSSSNENAFKNDKTEPNQKRVNTAAAHFFKSSGSSR